MDPFELFAAAFANDSMRLSAAVEYGQDPNRIHPQSGNTPLSVACQCGSGKAVETLLRLGADPNLPFTWRSRISGAQCSGRTALMSASTAEVVRMMSGGGADLNSSDEFGWTPLVHAVDMGNASVFEALLDAGAALEVAARRGQRVLDLAEFIREKINHLHDIAEAKRSANLEIMLGDLRRMQQLVIR